MLTREQTNFLLQCCRTAHFGDGATFLARPLRSSLYRWKRRAVPPPPPPTPPDPPEPVFTSETPTLFAGRPSVLPPDPHLLAEVEAQIKGRFRLAGGAIRPLGDPETLDDPEDRHSVHRLYWAVRYAQAVALGHPCAAADLSRRLDLWLQAPPSAEAQSAYTIAERAASCAELLFWHPGLAPPLLTALKRRLFHDACRLARNFEYHLGAHNHLLNNARGLYAAAGLLPECPESPAWRDRAFQVWDRYFPLLLHPDGAFAEQSSHYHLLLCRTALEYLLAVRAAGRRLPPGLEPRLSAMFRLANDLLRPDGSLPRFGDNSPDHTARDLWGLLTAAHHHGFLGEPPRHPAHSLLTLYYGATPPPPAPPPAPCRLYPDGGFAFLRAGAGQAELSAHADPAAKAAAHGDSGLGSFELWFQGRILIREPGCFLRPADARSAWYHSAEAQNVTSLDGLPPAIPLDEQLRLPEWYWRAEGVWSCPGAATLRFESSCFRRLQPGLRVTRTWSFPPEGGFLFEEILDGAGSLRLRSRIFPGDGLWADGFLWQDGAWCLQRLPQAGPAVSLVLTLPPGLAPTLQPAYVTPEYGIEEPVRAVVLTGRATLPCRWTLRGRFPLPANPTPGA